MWTVSTQDGQVEKKIAWIASRAWGVVTYAELRAAGISAAQVKWRADKGLLIRMYPGVYRVGHTAPSVEAEYMAAFKACGPEDALAGLAAGYLLGIVRRRIPPPPTVFTRTNRDIEGIETRRRRLHHHETWLFKGIRITTVARTLADLSSSLPFDELARTCHEAGVRYRTTPRQVENILRLHPNIAGSRKLRRIMRGEARVALSKLERRFLELLREAGLPLPITNRVVGAHRVDCHWPEYGITVELDSYTYHGSRHAWEQDRRRERDAYRGGVKHHRRYTYNDVFEDSTAMLAELRSLLAQPLAA